MVIIKAMPNATVRNVVVWERIRNGTGKHRLTLLKKAMCSSKDMVSMTVVQTITGGMNSAGNRNNYKRL